MDRRRTPKQPFANPLAPPGPWTAPAAPARPGPARLPSLQHPRRGRRRASGGARQRSIRVVGTALQGRRADPGSRVRRAVLRPGRPRRGGWSVRRPLRHCAALCGQCPGGLRPCCRRPGAAGRSVRSYGIPALEKVDGGPPTTLVARGPPASSQQSTWVLSRVTLAPRAGSAAKGSNRTATSCRVLPWPVLHLTEDRVCVARNRLHACNVQGLQAPRVRPSVFKLRCSSSFADLSPPDTLAGSPACNA